MPRLLLAAALVVGLAACQSEPDPAPAETPAAESPAIPTEAVSDEDLMPEVEMDDPAPAGEVVAEGTFRDGDGHSTSGRAQLYRNDDGSYEVRLQNLNTDNGPDLRVYLIRRTSGDIADGHASLGGLKSTRGNQTYDVPSNVDPTQFAGVSVWCRAFSVNFGTAPLN